MNNELELIWKEAVDAIIRHFAGVTKNNHENSQSSLWSYTKQ
jgi:hypothetical protein